MEAKFDMPFTVSMGVLYVLIGFAVIMVTYYKGLYFSKWNTDKVIVAKVLRYNK